jgi:quinol monooxygenase YgiN
MSAYLEISLKIEPGKRSAAAAVYKKYRQPFLDRIAGAHSKQLLVRDEDVQVLHGFDNAANARAYLASSLFSRDVVSELKPLLNKEPEVRIYEVAE